MSECRTCQAPILWASMPSGKLSPFDREPSPEGGWRLLPGEDGRHTAIFVPVEDREAGMVLHMSHFVTCMDADRWRRR